MEYVSGRAATVTKTTPSTSVVYVGQHPPADDALRIEHVAPDAVSDNVDGADCIVAEEPGGGLDVLASLDGALPTILYDTDGDPAVAARATQLGVTEYVTDTVLDGESLTDRIVAVTTTTAESDRARESTALELLYDVMTDQSLSLEEKTERLLAAGCERLGLDAGFLSNIEDDTHTIVTANGDHPAINAGMSTPLSETYCRRTLTADGLLGIHDAVATGNETDPAYESSGLQCYLGGKLAVNDELYGTLCFVSDAPRTEPFSESERRFVKLLIEWVSYELEREERERSLRWYRAIHETVEEMVFLIGENARIQLVTQPLADRFGYDRDDLVDEPATVFVGDDLVTRGYDALGTLQSGVDSVTIEATMETADCETVPVEVDFSLLSSSTEFEGLVGVVRDRTELSQTEAALAGERDRFQHLFDQIPDGVADIEFVDGEPLIRAANPAFTDTFADDERVVGEPLHDVIIPADNQDPTESLDADMLQTGYERPQIELQTNNGLRTFLLRGFGYSTGDDDRGFVIYTDITSRLERERRLSVLHRVLRHNLRNEMTAVIGYAKLLAEEAETAEHREYADLIYRRSNEVADLGKQVQRIEQALDRENRQPMPVDPLEVATDVAARFREAYPEATIRVSDSDAGAVVGDELLDRALDNLVENALEHHDGTPTVDIEVAATGDGWVDITVRDDGPGIPERERAVVSGEREITQLDHSVGLGLWVTRWIVDGVGGRLIFEDRADGSAVTLRLRRSSQSPR
ncbi:MAG: PAS domain S-box-containing protein [Natronomonas sp.]|jgi:PAS domain S-box-containing protein|uniref:PAS domain S-box protein n=1 Tax=Natronomonas sp. TaxID=2184060 RepID=UPI003988B22A